MLGISTGISTGISCMHGKVVLFCGKNSVMEVWFPPFEPLQLKCLGSFFPIKTVYSMEDSEPDDNCEVTATELQICLYSISMMQR